MKEVWRLTIEPLPNPKLKLNLFEEGLAITGAHSLPVAKKLARTVRLRDLCGWHCSLTSRPELKNGGREP